MSKPFGFLYRGSQDQLILGDDYPTLVQRYRGPIIVNRRAGVTMTHMIWFSGTEEQYYHKEVSQVGWGHGWCDVTYPAPITTDEPPFVFGVPNGSYRGGMGAFSHRGSRGNWTGFSVMVINSLWGANNWQGDGKTGDYVDIGFNILWDYRVCTFGAPPSSDRYGLRLYGSNGKLTFDSGWPIVFWRSLLTNWRALNTGTRRYGQPDYWGNPNSAGDPDQVMQVAAHPWGHQDGTMGVLLSSLAGMQVVGDVGDHNRLVNFPPTIGFVSGRRDEINMSLMYGTFQHPCAAVTSLPALRIMTADFSKT